MTSQAKTVTEYVDSLPDERKQALTELRNVILKNLPKGFSEGMYYGMPGYAVPHSLYPKGYHTDPKQPLPFISMASQKNHIVFYHMGLYSNEKLHKWFIGQWPKYSSKKPGDIPFPLIGELVSKITPEDWIKIYEENISK